jgi:hypothetical protein
VSATRKTAHFCRVTILRRSSLGQRLAGWLSDVQHTKKKRMEAKLGEIRFHTLGTTSSWSANSRSQTFAGAASNRREGRPIATVVITSEGSFFARTTDHRSKLVAGNLLRFSRLARVLSNVQACWRVAARAAERGIGVAPQSGRGSRRAQAKRGVVGMHRSLLRTEDSVCDAGRNVRPGKPGMLLR